MNPKELRGQSLAPGDLQGPKADHTPLESEDFGNKLSDSPHGDRFASGHVRKARCHQMSARLILYAASLLGVEQSKR